MKYTFDAVLKVLAICVVVTLLLSSCGSKETSYQNDKAGFENWMNGRARNREEFNKELEVHNENVVREKVENGTLSPDKLNKETREKLGY